MGCAICCFCGVPRETDDVTLTSSSLSRYPFGRFELKLVSENRRFKKFIAFCIEDILILVKKEPKYQSVDVRINSFVKRDLNRM
uniref:Uncharacterized protein n=1 Tax=Ciona intestinalis TaxID=7719 RepID=H2XV28_CIOIN